MKKISIFIIVFVVILLLFGGVWWFASRNSATPTGTVTGEEPRPFNPFGFFDDTETPQQGGSSSNTDDSADDFGVDRKNLLTKISDRPVAGSVFTTVTHGTSTDTLVRFVEKETGHIFDYSTTAGVKTRISNTTIPRIREAIWGNNALTVALRYLTEDGSVETFLGTIASSSTNGTSDSLLSGAFLPQNIVSLAVHPTLQKIFYIEKTQTGGAGYVSDGTTPKLVLTHPFSQWHLGWNGTSTVLMTTAPTRKVAGNAFLINTDSTSGFLSRIGSSTLALTTLPNTDGPSVVFGSVAQTGMGLFLYNTATKQTTPLHIGTLPEKCTWGGATTLYCGVPNNVVQNLPDDWYQGVVSFSDTLWKTDTTTSLSEFVLDPLALVSEGLDMTSFDVSPDGNFLSFINKKDGSLWLVDFSAQTEAQQNVSF